MISVVTITFNNYDELLKTVDSLKAVTTPFEHVIINGGSCVKTKEFLEKQFKGKSISEPDRGISDAFNKGIKLSTGDGIVFLNSGDILIDEEYLSLADKKLREYDFTYADILFDDSMAGTLKFKPHGKPLGRGMPYPHQTMIVKKEIFSKIGDFSLNYKNAMCFEFVCRMHKINSRGYYYKNSVVLMDGAGISTSKEDMTLEESKRALIDHDLWSFANKIAFFERQLFFNIRQIMIKLGLKKVLVFLKKSIRK